MPQYIEYQLEDGGSLLVQAPEGFEAQWAVKTAGGQENVIQAEKTFGDAMEGVRASAAGMLKKFKELRADEVELKFGLTATGELGNFAIGKVGVEANYEVTLKWTNKKENKPATQ